MPRSTLPPPTEKTRTASRCASRDPRSHSAYELSHPSSLIRAVSSETLSEGEYASNPASFRKSLTACDACPAPPPEPTTVTASPASVSLYSGSIRSGGAGRLGADDNAYFEVNSTTSGTRQSDWYGRMTGVTNALQSLKITYRGKASRSCTQQVYVYNWTNGSWVRLDSRSVSTSEIEVNVSPTGTLADYVSGTSGDGEVAVRIRCYRSDYSFYTSADLLRITYQR